MKVKAMVLASFALIVVSLAFAPRPADAAPRSGPVVASFEGHSLNLASGWGDARACLIWRSRGIAECFRTEAELGQREIQLRSLAASSTATSTCADPLNLYSGSYYSGLHLALWDEGYWQELSDYGFADLTVSFVGGPCGFHLADGDWGQGYWYPGYTGPWASTTDMGSWDDTVKSAYIN
jgi:hypothetical protein